MPSEPYRRIAPVELLECANDMNQRGCRLVQICCSRTAQDLELDYSFDDAGRFVDVKLQVKPTDEITSISSVYYYAFLYENEIEALFGLRFVHKAVDFEGKLYRMAQTTPFARKDGDDA